MATSNKGGQPNEKGNPIDGLRAVLMGSTIIPSCGMTFEEALTELYRKNAMVGTGNTDVSETADLDGMDIASAILATPPLTITDARVILDVLTDPDDGIEGGVGERDIAAVRNVAALLSTIAKNAMGIPNRCLMEGDAK